MNVQAKSALGPAAAALVAAGIGSFAFGLMICATEALPAFKKWANWYSPVGPLSGKSGMAVIIWLAAWALLHVLWRDRSPVMNRVVTVSFVLVALGFLGSFPPIFDLFGK